MKSLSIAMLCHSLITAYAQACGEVQLKSWDDEPQSEKDRLVSCVELNIANAGMTPEQMHKNWVDGKQAAGWIYGSELNAESKQHPYILAFEDLPPEIKVKDYLIYAAVNFAKDLPESSEHNAMLTELISAKTQLEKYKQVLINAAAPARAAKTATQDGVSVIYVGFRPEHIDKMYGSGVHFIRENPKTIPKWLADKLLNHPEFKLAEVLADAVASDLNEEGKPSSETLKTIEETQKKNSEKDDEETADLDAKDLVSQFNDKDSLIDYAMVNFNTKLTKNNSIETLKSKIHQLIDQQGIPK